MFLLLPNKLTKRGIGYRMTLYCQMHARDIGAQYSAVVLLLNTNLNFLFFPNIQTDILLYLQLREHRILLIFANSDFTHSVFCLVLSARTACVRLCV